MTEKGISLTDPVLVAEQFLTDYIWTQNPDDPKPETSFYTLRRWRTEWFLWKGGRYIHLAGDTVKQNLTTYLQAYCKEVYWGEEVRIAVTRNFVANVVTNIEAKVHIRETQQLNTFLDDVERGRFLCLENGLLNLRTHELISHSPNFFTVIRLPYPYDAHAKCPQWEAFLKEIMLQRGDYVELLQEFIGYLFRPDLREQRFLLCVGEGANGKTTFFDVVRALVGSENCSEVPISRFGERFSLYSTIGKVCNLTHESSHMIEDEAENILKSYVSGDRMTVDRKNRDPVEVAPTAKLLIATNSLPRFSDKTQAIWRRIVLVPFDLTLDEKLQVKDKSEQLKAELPGILNWALAGLDRLNTNGFTVPQGQRELMEEYRRDADPTRAFLMDNYEESPNGTYVPCAELYRDYTTFCETNGCHSMNERTFGQHVKRIFPQVMRRRLGTGNNREYVYEGLLSVHEVPPENPMHPK